MSIENLKAFGTKIAKDEQVRERAKEIGLNPAGIIAYGKELGLDFNEADLKALADEAGNIEDELSEEQLEMIAGGLTTTTTLVLAVGGVIALGAVAGSIGSVMAATLTVKQW